MSLYSKFGSSLLLILWSYGVGQGQSQDTLQLKNLDSELILPMKDLSFFEDRSAKMSFEEIRQNPELFQKKPSFRPGDYNVDAAYWVKLTLETTASKEGVWILEFFDQTIDHLTIYQPNSDETYDKIEMGDMRPFLDKTFHHKNFEIIVDPNLTGVHSYYFRVHSHSYADITIAIRAIDRFIHYALNEYLIYGFFYGMILIICLYNLLIYSAIREIKYLYYTFYILSVGVYALCLDGIAYQYLWPESSEWNQIAYGVALFSIIFWALIFGQRFLNTKMRAPRIHKVLNLLIVLRSLWFLYTVIFDHSLFAYRNIEIVSMLAIFFASILVWTRGYKPARFFIIAYGFLFLGFLFKALLMNVSVAPKGILLILSYYSLHICFLLEMLFLTFALSDRVRILKANRDRATKRIILQHQENARLKDKVNKELESRIKERTRELEDKNILLARTNNKLSEQTKEINKINSMLDLDNWKLKNNIKEIIQDRLINKNLSYEEFSKVFPDKLSCYRFLEKLKWGKGYECPKCANHKYSPGQVKYSRRCSRCGYNESVTSNSVFHHIKFPIEKAFYLLYLANNKQNNYTLDELSEILDLRRNTIWSFRKKIASAGKGESKHQKVVFEGVFNTHLN